MSKIVAYREQISQLMNQLVTVEKNYTGAKLIYENALAYEADPTGADLSIAVELLAQLDDQVLRLPLPSPGVLADMAANAADSYAKELARLWHEVHEVSKAAAEHLAAAVAVATADQNAG